MDANERELRSDIRVHSRPFADHFPAWLELGAIIAWAAFVGRGYLSFDPLTLPAGYFNEFGSAIMSHAVLTNPRACGLCVLWNGAVNGGNPAFAELHGAPLHPLVAGSTLLWGTITGAKVVVVASLALAGVAQWWLARVQGLSRLPRLWGALLAVTGSHLLARLDQGVVAVVLSTAACSLLLAPLLDTLLTGSRRSAVLLGIMLALALVSGQGYLQLGVALGLSPAVAVSLLWRAAGRGRYGVSWRWRLAWRCCWQGFLWFRWRISGPSSPRTATRRSRAPSRCATCCSVS